MMKKWEDFLIFVGEIRKALALDDQEKEWAFNRPPTITEEEFHELRMSERGEGPASSENDPEAIRWGELTGKWIGWNETAFHGHDDNWSLNMGPDVFLEYDKQSGWLKLEWNEEWEEKNIVPLMTRLLLIVPHDTIVRYSHLLVSKSTEIQDGQISLVVSFECSGLEAQGDFMTFALKTASLYNAAEEKPKHKLLHPKKTVTS